MSDIITNTQESIPRASTALPLISVIIPNYNRSELLQQAIASVKAQTYTNWELIIVDDGSTDETVETVQKINDPKIQVVSLSHTGHIGNVTNIGVKTSKGEWLAFLDSDDVWMPEKLEWQFETLQKEKKRWVYGFFEYIDENEKRIYTSPERFPPYEGKIIKEVILGKTGITICSIMIEKKLFEETGGFSLDPAVRNDYEFLLRLTLNSEVAVTKEIVLKVRDHSKRTYKSRTYPNERSALTYKAFIDLDPAKELKRLAQKQYAYLLAEASVHRFANGDNRKALKQLAQSFGKDKLRHWLSALKRGIYAAFKKYFQPSAKKREAEDVAAYHT